MPPYPEHLREFDYLGVHRYFLTICTHRRRALFREAHVVELVREQFMRACADEHFAVLAYCFMPDHVHLLVEGRRETSDLKRFVKLAKQLSGFQYKQLTGRPLWQRYSFERVLRNEEITVDVARYVIANPVRAELVVRPADYPFWGSFVFTREELLEYVSRAA
jgi:putative transposase